MEKIRVEVLVATMNQKDHSLLKKMNIQTPAIVGNQCNIDLVEKFEYEGNSIKWFSFNEKGVGLNRNNALMRARGEFLVFADDDMIFENGYEDIVVQAFDRNPKADIIIFNLNEAVKSNRRKISKQHYTKKIGYGAARIVCRKDVIHEKGIFFNLCFGGGTRYSRGEDTLFLSECIRKKCRILCIPQSIAQLINERESTWFNGYNDKYFFDSGVLLAAAGVKAAYLRAFKAAIQAALNKQGNIVHIYKLYCQGIIHYRARRN